MKFYLIIHFFSLSVLASDYLPKQGIYDDTQKYVCSLKVSHTFDGGLKINYADGVGFQCGLNSENAVFLEFNSNLNRFEMAELISYEEHLQKCAKGQCEGFFYYSDGNLVLKEGQFLLKIKHIVVSLNHTLEIRYDYFVSDDDAKKSKFLGTYLPGYTYTLRVSQN